MKLWSPGLLFSALALVLACAVPGAAWGQAGGAGANDSVPVVWLALGALGVAIVVAAIVIWRRQEAEQDSGDLPPLLFPAAPVSRPRPARAASLAPRPAPVPPATTPGPFHHDPTPLRAAAAPAAPPPVQHAAASAPRLQVAAVADLPAAGLAQSADTLVDGKTIRFHKPVEGTLQILPGRLEIVEGADTGHSIRFVRAGAEPEVTFGRSDGPPYRHIQLRAATVSRKHAQMRFENTAWRIRNLSQTNPVVVNGEELGVDGSARVLQEGDRIEMGEITFVFRER